MKKAYFFIDDTIWVMRDLTRNCLAHLFDNPFLGMLKTMHEIYGLKVQLNLFYSLSYFYGADTFTLAEMTDAYRTEWEEASNWLKLAFHAKEEFPDYPHVNISYEDMRKLYSDFEREVCRFAGEKSIAKAVCPHWSPMSKGGVKALAEAGIRIMDATVGDTMEYDGNPDSLPYGHALRLMHNRQPETKIFSRGTRDAAIDRSLCAYNHFPESCREALVGTGNVVFDQETGMCFMPFESFENINLIPYDEIEQEFEKTKDREFLGICDHEQYFYPEYFAYQPDYAQKIEKMAELLATLGYTYIFAEELAY